MKVLLTRRLAASERSALKLKEIGHEALILPLFEVVETDTPVPQFQPDFLMLTSAVAAEAFVKKPTIQNTGIPVYCVGARTASALTGSPYKNIRAAKGTASALGNMVLEDFGGVKASGLYPCGKMRAFDFETFFSDTGITIGIWEVYDMLPADLPADALKKALKAIKHGGILVYSPIGTRALFDKIAQEKLEDLAAECLIVAISENCTTQIPRIFQANVTVAGEPNEASIFRVLDHISQSRQ